MSYFLPTFLQKRILRYALSRLELLDTDALDLENLDIVWGKKSRIELRDVGIHLGKISALLKLQPNFTITKAKISTLLVIVPADLYQSSIVLEVDEIDVDVRADSSEDQTGATFKESTYWDGRPGKPSRTVKADRPRRTHPIVHDPGGWPDSDESSDDEDIQLPTTFDLAQSFVQAEPTQERSELQAAVARSLYLNHSQTSSDDSLDGSELGVGTENYLPAFLAGFLKGVGDRVQVTIERLKVDLDVSLANKDDAQAVEDVKIRLLIGSISVDEASQNSAGKHTRRIAMKSIHLSIISEPSLFSNLARSAAPSSPETAQASTVMTAPDKLNESSPSIANTKLSTHSVGHSVADLRELQASTLTSHESVVDKGTESQASSVRRLANTGDAVDDQHDSSMFSDSFYSSGEHSSNENEGNKQDQPLRDSSVLGIAFDGTASMRTPPKPDASQDLSSSHDSPPAAFGAFSPPFAKGTASLTTIPSPTPQTGGAHDLVSFREGSTASLSRFSSPKSRPTSPSPEDLSESKIFSHEDAESMYMSAMSSDLPRQSDSPSRNRGGWTSSGPAANEVVPQPNMIKDADSERESGYSSPVLTNKADDEDHTFKEGYVTDRSKASTTLSNVDDQKDDQKAQQASNSGVEPTTGSPPAAIGHSTFSFQESISPASSSRDQNVLAKRIFLIDDMSVELPVEVRKTTAQFREGPDAHISIEKSIAARSAYDPAASSVAVPPHDRVKASSTALSEELLEPPIIVTIGKLQIVGDVGLTKLTILLTERLIALNRSSTASKRKANHSGTLQQGHYIVFIECLSWKFLDLVKGSFVPDNAPSTMFSKDALVSEDSDVLLRSDISKTELSITNTQNKTITKLTIGKFAVGYVDNNILSFKSGLNPRDSARDISLPKDKDFSLIVIETNGIRSIDVATLPLHMVLDLRKLDEAFSWFGGFSSMLGLGSSMMSTVTLRDPKAKALPISKASREVHFERPEIGRSPNIASTPTKQQQKITARMGGFVLNLLGTKTALQLETTAIKVVSRSEGIGLQIDRLAFSGPSTEYVNADLPITAKLSNVRVEYLTIPKENDLTRLLTLLAPSKDTYDDGDDILVDTLIRQRKKGGVLRATVESATLKISDPHALQCFPLLAEEAKKLATVAKYLPEDDRPGLLTLLLIKSLKAEVHTKSAFGFVNLDATNAEIAYVTFPSLIAFGINHCSLSRNNAEELVGKALSSPADAARPVSSPMIMGRFVGNEMEPTVKLKFHNARFEYHVTTITAFMESKDHKDAEELLSDMANSVATLTSRQSTKGPPATLQSHKSASSSRSFNGSKALGFDVAFRDSILGLNPRHSQAKGLFVLTDTHFMGSMPKEENANATLEIRKAELMIVDDLLNVLEHESSTPRSATGTHSTQIQALAETGYVSVSQVSAAKIVLQVVRSKPDSGPAIDVEIKDDLFVLESCADSTQTLMTILNGLKPPTPTSTALKYQTEVVPVEDMLASFSGGAFEMDKDDRLNEGQEVLDFEEGDMVEDDVPQNLEYVSSFYSPDPETSVSEVTADSVLDDDLDSIATPSMLREIGDKNLLESFQEQTRTSPGQALDFKDDHFGVDANIGVAAHTWDPKHNISGHTKEKLPESPLQVRVRDVHIIWNLFDGYDWQHTRDSISQAVAQIQHQAVERQAARKRSSVDPGEEDEDVIGDFFVQFNLHWNPCKERSRRSRSTG